jgi:hypothetical protein
MNIRDFVLLVLVPMLLGYVSAWISSAWKERHRED